MEIPDDLFAPAHRVQHAFNRVDILFQPREIQLPAQAGAGQAHDLIALLGHQFFLHVAFRADEKDLAVRVFFPQLIGHGDGRVNMARGAAAGKNQVHRGSS